MDRNTVRVLCLDGGGVRGYLSLKYLQKFIQKWGINGNELWKYFDVIGGTSIGGIQALGYAYGKSPDDLETFFVDKSKRIFTIRTVTELLGCDANTDGNRPNVAQKVALILDSAAFYESHCPADDGNSNYGTNILQQVLVENFGTDDMGKLKTHVIIPSYEKDSKKYVLFSNYNDERFFLGKGEQIVNVARATSAAPVYLPKHSFSGHDYIDGGIYLNNPTNLCLTLAMKMKPRANRACVLSIGTGLGEQGFQNNTSTDEDSSTVSDIFGLFGTASTGAQESVDFDLKLRSSGTLERLFYHRFQPKLDPNKNTELDNSDESFLRYMRTIAEDGFNDNLNSVEQFIAHLEA